MDTPAVGTEIAMRCGLRSFMPQSVSVPYALPWLCAPTSAANSRFPGIAAITLVFRVSQRLACRQYSYSARLAAVATL